MHAEKEDARSDTSGSREIVCESEGKSASIESKARDFAFKQVFNECTISGNDFAIREQYVWLLH